MPLTRQQPSRSNRANPLAGRKLEESTEDKESPKSEKLANPSQPSCKTHEAESCLPHCAKMMDL